MENRHPDSTVPREAVAVLVTLVIILGAVGLYSLANATATEPSPPAQQQAPAVTPVVKAPRRAHRARTRAIRARGAVRVRFDRLPPLGNFDPRMLGFQWPVAGGHEITSPYGPRDGGFHHGTDIGCAIGQPLYASRAGRVMLVGDAEPGYGLTVMIDHGSGYQTLYAHMSKLEVQLGQFVRTRQEIGRCGATGNASGTHVHFEMRYGGYVWDPVRFLP
jgi:murein DD-endopeptidase MepM/ murein hydrolase activator NlpD